MSRLSRCMVTISILFLLTNPVAAESKISFRQITRTHPVAVQRGTSATIEVSSNFTLNGAHATFFDPPGVRMEFAESEVKASEWKDPAESDIGQAFRFQVIVPKGQLPGVREYRIATDQSVSSVAHLLVTDHPIVIEQSKDNSSPIHAQRVPVPSAVCGVVEQFEDVDYYRVSGKAGQDLVCQIFAQRVTRAIHCMAIRYPKIHLMDSMLTLIGPEGQIVGQNDNHVGGDALLHVRLPATGEYVLEVRDTRYAGDPRYTYCVEITNQPVAHGLFPLAVQRPSSDGIKLDQGSSPAEFEVVHSRPQNVDPAPSDPQRLPSRAVARSKLGWQRVRPSLEANDANPVALLVSSHPQLTADGAHDSLDSALELSLPIGVSGRLLLPNQTHYYRFAAQKDVYYSFEVQAQRRGYAVDSLITILDSAGKSLAEADDDAYTKDARLDFQAPRDDSFVVAIRDLNGRSGERYAYHLQAAASGPDFELHGEYYYGMLAAGGRAIWFARLKRLNGFDGPVQVLVDGLPQGVSFTPVTIPGGMNHCGLIFSAAEDAPINASLVRVRGRAQLPRSNGKTIDAIRQGQVTCELRRAGASRFVRAQIRTQLLGVTKPLDLTKVVAHPSQVSLQPGGTAEIQVRIARSPDYADQVLLDTAFSFFSAKYGEQLPPGVTMAASSQTKLVGDNLIGTIVLEANQRPHQVDRLPIAVLARVPITYSIMTNYASNPIYLSISGNSSTAAD